MNSIRDFILFQDHHLVICNKPSGLPVQDDKSGDHSLLRLLRIYCKQELYLCHRIDRPVSGLVVLAKNLQAVTGFNEQLHQHAITKKYLAIVEKQEVPPSAILTDTLVKSAKFKKSYVQETGDGKESKLEYMILQELEQYLVLEIKLFTGRFHQIRSQLSHAGIPVRGDVKYGARRGLKDRSIGLHSWKIEFKHPSTHAKITFVAPLPVNDIWPVVQTLISNT